MDDSKDFFKPGPGLPEFRKRIMEDLDMSVESVQKRAAELEGMIKNPEGRAALASGDTRRLVQELWMLADQIASEKEKWAKVLQMDYEQAARIAEERARQSEASVRRLEAYSTALEKELHELKTGKVALERAVQESRGESLRFKGEINRLIEFNKSTAEDAERRVAKAQEELRAQYEQEAKIRGAGLETQRGQWARRESELRGKFLAEIDAWSERLRQAEEDWAGRLKAQESDLRMRSEEGLAAKSAELARVRQEGQEAVLGLEAKIRDLQRELAKERESKTPEMEAQARAFSAKEAGWAFRIEEQQAEVARAQASEAVLRAERERFEAEALSIRKDLEERRVRLDESRQRLEESEKKRVEEREALEGARRAVERQLDEAKAGWSVVSAELKAAAERHGIEFGVLQQQLIQQTKELEAMRLKSERGSGELDRLLAERDRLTGELARRQQLSTAADQRIHSLQGELASAAAERRALEEELASKIRGVETARNQANRDAVDADKLRLERDRLLAEIERIKAEGGAADQRLRIAQAELKVAAEMRDALSTELEQARRSLEAGLGAGAVELDRIRVELEQTKAELASERKSLEESRAGRAQDVAYLRSELEQARQPGPAQESEDRIRRLEEEVQAKSQELLSFRAELERLSAPSEATLPLQAAEPPPPAEAPVEAPPAPPSEATPALTSDQGPLTAATDDALKEKLDRAVRNAQIASRDKAKAEERLKYATAELEWLRTPVLERLFKKKPTPPSGQ